MSKSRQKTSSQKHSSLSHHRREGKELLTPSSRIKIWEFVSWVHDRLPDQVWAGLLMSAIHAARAAAMLKRELGLQVELVEGRYGEFTVSGWGLDVPWGHALSAEGA